MMANSTGPVDMSKELAALQHEKKNQSMKKLPLNATIQRRPLSHPAIAPPQAGSHVQKVVYVSCRTPVMSAVKRVKKLLQHIEKRATQGIEAKNHGKPYHLANLRELSDKLAKSPEEVLVKASGRAMEQALRVGEWFRTKENDFMCNVEVRTGSVPAVDDIVVDDNSEAQEGDSWPGNHEDMDQTMPLQPEETTLEGGDTTLDILGDHSASIPEKTLGVDPSKEAGTITSTQEQGQLNHKRKRKKRKRAAYDGADVPEARIRWVKTVEVAISLKV